MNHAKQNYSILALVLTVILGMKLPAFATDVTIYPQGNAVFQDNVSLSLKEGSVWVPLLQGMDISDLQVFPSAGVWPKGVQFLGIQSPPRTGSIGESYLNKSIWVKDVVTDKYVKGVLKQLTPETYTAVVQVGTALWQVPASQVLVREVASLQEAQKKEGYVAHFISDTAKNVPVDVLYQVGGLRSDVNYVWQVPQDLQDESAPITLTAWLSLYNQSTKALHQAHVKALFGASGRAEVSPSPMLYQKAGASQMAADAMMAPPTQLESVGESLLLNLAQPVDLERGQNGTYLWKQWTPKAVLRYVYAPTENGWWWQSGSQGRFDAPTQAVRHFLEVPKWELDPLPEGAFRVYQRDAQARLQELSNGRQAYQARQEPLRLALGEAPDLRATKRQVSYSENTKQILVGYEVVLKNTKLKAVNISVQEYPQDRWFLDRASQTSTHVVGVPVAFEVNVPAQSETTLSYTFKFVK